MLNKIYDNHKRFIILAFVCSFMFCLFGMFYFYQYNCIIHKSLINLIEKFISNIITFVSISFGFYLTSSSILFSSQYIKTLNKEDELKPSQRKIHTLKEYFKLAIYNALFTISISFFVLLAIAIQNDIVLIILFSISYCIFDFKLYFHIFIIKSFWKCLNYTGKTR